MARDLPQGSNRPRKMIIGINKNIKIMLKDDAQKIPSKNSG